MPPTWKHLSFVSVFILLCMALVSVAQNMGVQAAPLLAPLAVPGTGSDIFINEFHYDNTGGDTGEFIEIAGPDGTDLAGWSVVLYNGSGGAVYGTPASLASIPIEGCNYGFVNIQYPTNGIQNGAPDGIALVNGTTVVQFLSYEGAFTGSGGPANGSTSTDIGVSENGTEPIGQSLSLKGSGTIYDDFTWSDPFIASPGDVNAGQVLGDCDAPPAVTSVLPANNRTGVSVHSEIRINFSDNVLVTEPWFEISCSNSGIVPATVSGGPQAFTLDPNEDFGFNESCTVTLDDVKIVDQDGGEALPLTSDYSWTFTTLIDRCADTTETPIHDIQGSGLSTPIPGASVAIKGVVVGDYQGGAGLSGFYLQEENGQTDVITTTSEGIFVFDPLNLATVSEDDVVRVEGIVSEFGDAGVSLTELINITQLQICGSDPSITPSPINMPVSSLADWEPFEGMLVTIPQQLTVSENFTLGRFGEIVLSANGRLLQPTHIAEPGAPAQAEQAANDLNRIVLDDGSGIQNPDPVIHPSSYLSATNTLRSGDTAENLTGILDQRFDIYRIQPVGTPNFVESNPRPTEPEEVGSTLTVAAANVLNYFTTLDQGSNQCGPPGDEQDCRGANSAEEFSRQRAKIINGLGAINADIVGLIELENNPTAAIEDLVAGLNALPGVGPYAYIDTGYIGTDAIKVALIYKPATVTPIGDYKILDSSVDPAFIDTLNRPVLAQTFQENATTERFTVAVNHLKSKGSACAGDPNTGDGQGNCNLTRTAAATALVNWLAGDPTASGDPDFLIIGDLNSYAMEDPIDAIKNAGYINLMNRFHGDDAYSYVFGGQTGYLDHALASSNLDSQVMGVTEWHVNADEPVALDYNLDFQSEAQKVYFYTPEPYRFSDHDPLVIGLELESETTITIVKDARPDNRRNFRFHGDLGHFKLDDPGFDDHDPVGSSITFDVEHGTYTISEDVPHFWHLTNIACSGGSTSVDLANHSVAITLIASQHVTCTFTNEYGSAIWVDKYHDRNANGHRFWEAGLPGWEMKLYNSAGTLVAADTTNIFGKVHFWDVAPGSYTLCETQRTGWFNSQPGTTDPTYNQPCYSLNIGPAQLWSVEFGNHRNAHAASATVTTLNAPSAGELTIEDVDDESYEDDGPFVDPDLNRPAQGESAPLFLPQITR